jgi:hypothetical protein
VIQTNTIDETTSASGVTVDSVLLKDGQVTATSLNLTLQSLAAAGASQTDAALVVPGTVNVTGATGTNGVKLPAVATGLVIPIYNSDSANALLVYPTAGGSVTINGGTANLPISVPAKTLVLCTCTSATNWAVMIVNTVAAADTIAEVTPTAGVTVDGVILKDTTVDVNGTADAIILDADGDTTISSPTGNQIDFEINSADDFTMTANTFTALAGSTIKTDTLAETTTGAGVTCSNAFQAHGNAAVTATTGGGSTGLIPAGASFVTVTSDSANKQITLPAGTIGDVIRIQTGTTGCELIAVTAADKVNNVVVGITNELALAASCLYVCEYVAANDWRVHGYTLAGAPLGPTTTALATISIADAAGTPDYALQALTTTLPYGLATAEEAITLMYVVQNLQLRVAELETAAKLTPDSL